MRYHDSFWRQPPDVWRIDPGAVHVWRVALNAPEEHIEACYQLLSEEERLRAERYCFDEDRRHFVACRGALRTILGRYLGVAPAWLRFACAPQGKPFLDPQCADTDALRYNVAQARGLGLVAVAARREVGVDIEYVWQDLATPEAAQRFLSPAEYAEFAALPEAERTEAFFNGWTRKEAYLKALGAGPSFPLRACAVSLAPGQPARLLAAPNQAGRSQDWSLISLDADGGYAAALVVEGFSWRLHCWQFTAWPVGEPAKALI
ncbi:MAG: 4'-phosphopantetheinyl transferase family protein [Anaerolineae bacterium]